MIEGVEILDTVPQESSQDNLRDAMRGHGKAKKSRIPVLNLAYPEGIDSV
jgi:hypothetical protein